MPILDADKCICVNDSSHSMEKSEQLTALLPVSGHENDIAGVLGPKAAVFVEAYICADCGYIELYKTNRRI